MTPTVRWQDPEGIRTLNSIVKKVIPQWKDGLRPVQEELVAPILDGDDILCCAATGQGKSAGFSVPILVLNEYNNNRHLYPVNLRTRPQPVGLVITPTKGLANNIVSELTKLGIIAITYCRETLADTRRAGINLATEIKECTKWQVICVDPEHLRDKEWRMISEWPVFRSRLLFTAADEAHLIREWGLDFRPSFRMIGLFVRGHLPPSTSVLALSATLAPGKDTSAICQSLGLYGKSFHLIRHSNERPNIQFIIEPLTHGLAGYEFPNLLPYLSTGRKLCIHCATLDLIFRVYIYIWRLQPAGADKMRRTRMYTSLCSPDYNQETIRLIDENPHCQIIIATIAFSNGINAKSILDSISLGFASTLDIALQEKGRAGRAEGSIARGIILVQPATVAAAVKQLQGAAPSAITPPTKKRKSTKKSTKPTPPMPHEKALILTETHCYIAFINRHYSNPPLETSTLDCIAANRLLPCSLCLTRAKRTLVFSAPSSSTILPVLTPPSAVPSRKVAIPRKLKLKLKEKDNVTAALIVFRDKLRVKEQMQRKFRNMPATLFLPTSLQTTILDNLLSLKSETDLVPLLTAWPHRMQHTAALFSCIKTIQRSIHAQREVDRVARNAKAQETRQKAKRKRAGDESQEEGADDANTAVVLPSRKSQRVRKRVVPSDDDEGDDSDSAFPESVPITSTAPRARPRGTAVKMLTLRYV
ncbi:P-loop containing nucleoside triphosphate hydrolase protein [Mycena maculata]|uniref:P-loop containing nucleoside triphosphate hydrolase protein n=1 Tax=Mycena maculata TaxID=230809 RepID=A0AAD7NVN7_9AGAR|nr:P-loop containing nucleoside triphosphate hydrolase protein [Mycena maculata]